MISRINLMILDIFKKNNPAFKDLFIMDNIITFKEQKLDLKVFNLEYLFESYQFKKDFNYLNSLQLFDIIDINAKIYIANSEETKSSFLSLAEFKEIVANGNINDELTEYLKLMKKTHFYQNYLINKAFSVYQEFIDLSKSLTLLDTKSLNQAQKYVLKSYQEIINQNISKINHPSDNEGGTKLVLNSNGIINTLLIVISTITLGVFISWIFIARL